MNRPANGTAGTDELLAEASAAFDPTALARGARAPVADVPADIKAMTEAAKQAVEMLLSIDSVQLEQGIAQILRYLRVAPVLDPAGFREDMQEVIRSGQILSAIRVCQTQLLEITVGDRR